MIDYTQETSLARCDGCRTKELSLRHRIVLGSPLDGPLLEVHLCHHCLKELLTPLKHGFMRDSMVKVKAKDYDASDSFKVIAIYEEVKAVRVRDEEGHEHIVQISEVSLA